MSERTYRVITHIHSVESNALASPGYDQITQLSRRILGAALDRVHWCECLTTVSTLMEVLEGKRTVRPVDLLFVTDHKSPRQHRIPADLIRTAAACPRLGIGAEIVTFVLTEAGAWIAAPEILMYGPAEPHLTAGGRYYGLSDQILHEVFAACTPPGAPGPELTRVVRYCLDRRIAYAASHPLDGNRLPLADLLCVLRLFPFIETVNGGFSKKSARLLTRLLQSENQRALARGTGPTGPAADSREPEFHVRHMLGGSDAHLRDFDRAVTRFVSPRADPSAGDFIVAMLAAADDPLGADGRFTPEGHGIGLLALGREVIALVHRNITNNRHAIRGVLPTARLMLTAVSQLWKADRSSRGRQRELSRYLDTSG